MLSKWNSFVLRDLLYFSGEIKIFKEDLFSLKMWSTFNSFFGCDIKQRSSHTGTQEFFMVTPKRLPNYSCTKGTNWSCIWRKAWKPTLGVLPGEPPRTEEPGARQHMGLQRVAHGWATKHTVVTRSRERDVELPLEHTTAKGQEKGFQWRTRTEI